MAIEDDIFNQLVELDILNYEEAKYPHECTCCGNTTDKTYRLREFNGIDANAPYLYICEDCHREALEVPRWRNGGK